MERFNELPAAARIGIIAGIAIVAGLLLYMIAFRGDGSAAVASYSNEAEAQAALWRLENSSGTGANAINPNVVANGDTWELRVPAVQQKMARDTLGFANAGIKDNEACKETSMLATSSEKDAARACLQARQIEEMLRRDAGVLQAMILINTGDSGGLGREMADGSASLQIAPAAEANLKTLGKRLATMVATSHKSLTTNSIYISTTDGTTLYDPSGGTGAGTADGGSLENCSSAETYIDYERCAKSTREAEYTRDLIKVVGDPDRVDVSVTVEVNTSASTTTTSEVRNDAVAVETKSKSTSKSGTASSESVDETTENLPSRSLTNTTTPQGSIKRETITVTLKAVPPSVEKAVRDMVLNWWNEDRGDKRPEVNNLPQSAIDELEREFVADEVTEAAASEAAEAAAEEAADESGAVVATDTRTLVTAFTAIAVLLLGMVLVFWRRSQKLAAERKAFEHEFSNDMTRFQTVASRQPDELAREIETWLGGQNPQSQSGRDQTPQQ